MDSFSDYIVYADESGDHGLASINPQMPVFVLAFCIFKKQDYIRHVVPSVQQLKFRFWGHDGVILHNHEIRKRRNAFNILLNPHREKAFMDDLNTLLASMPVTIIAAVIDKKKLATHLLEKPDPYHIALSFCVEELGKFLDEQSERSRLSHIVAERRGEPEDKRLEHAFARESIDWPQLRLTFMDKKHNSTGLQIADLVAHPIARHAINRHQANRAYDLLKSKLRVTGYVTWRDS